MVFALRGVVFGYEQVHHAVTDHHVLPQGHRAVLGNDNIRAAAHRIQPRAELLNVRHRRRQRNDVHMLGKVNNRLFPHRATETVRQVVHLIHHHIAQAGQRGRVGVEHVAQHLGGHHDHGCFRVNARIAGEQTHVILTVRAHKVVVFLVAQRLNRGRVERLHAAAQRQVDTELTHNGLTGTRGCGNEDGAVRLHGGTRLTLKIIQRKIQGRFKSPQGGLRVGGALSGCGVGGSVVSALRRGLLVRSVRSVCVGLCVVLAHSMSSVTVRPPQAFRKHPAQVLIRYGRTASASAARYNAPCESRYGGAVRADVRSFPGMRIWAL